MSARILGADRLEGAEADVEGDVLDLDALCFQRVEDLGGEVEAGRGRGGGAGLVGVDGLVAGAILSLVVAVDVRGERHVAYFVEDGLEVRDRGEAQGAFAEVAGGEDLGFEEEFAGGGVGEVEAVAGLDLAAGTDQRGPDVFAWVLVGKLLREQDFDAAGGVGRVRLGVRGAGAGGEEAGRDDTAVVEDEEVAILQIMREFGEHLVAVGAGRAVDGEHAAGAAHCGRRLGD